MIVIDFIGSMLKWCLICILSYCVLAGVLGLAYDYFFGDWSFERHQKAKAVNERVEPYFERIEPK